MLGFVQNYCDTYKKVATIVLHKALEIQQDLVLGKLDIRTLYYYSGIITKH